MPVLVDSNIILDIFTRDKRWFGWSSEVLAAEAERDLLCINPVIYAEISTGFEQIEMLESLLPHDYFQRQDLPYEAAFLASKCFLRYRKRGGTKASTLPDFFIGAHAAVKGWKLMTRDKVRYADYFPSLPLITPEQS